MKPTYRVSLAPPVDTADRRALRLLLMVLELHKAGYQLLRVATGMSPSGAHWRCHITSADNIRGNGWEPRNCEDDPKNWGDSIAFYTSGQEDKYFGWEDGPGKSARQLAALFLDRFPAIARRGAGWDWSYAGWYVTMLGAAEAGEFPVFFADYDIDIPIVGLPPAPQR